MTDERIEGAMKKGVGHVEDAVGGLTGDDKTQAKGKLNEAAGSVQDVYGQVKDKAQDAYGQAKDKAQDYVGQAKDKAQDYFGQAQDYVQDKPEAAVGIAVAVGVVLGFLLRGGRKVVYVRK